MVYAQRLFAYSWLPPHARQTPLSITLKGTLSMVSRFFLLDEFEAKIISMILSPLPLQSFVYKKCYNNTYYTGKVKPDRKTECKYKNIQIQNNR